MQTASPQVDISRVFDAPRDLVYRSFTDPDHFVTWWGPIGNSLPREEIEFDVRSGGYQRWTELLEADPRVRVHVEVALTDVIDGEVLDGRMHISGHLPNGIEAFETRIRVEFYDEPDGRTRLKIRQWIPEHLTGNADQGWLQAFSKLCATLNRLQASSSISGMQ